MPASAISVFREAWAQAFRPEPMLTVSAWADRHRHLSARAAAEPGLWRTSRTPYLKAIMDALSPSDATERVVFMKGAQIGGTEAGNNWLGYVIHQAPGPMLVVYPTVETAKRASRQRVDPLIEESPALRGLVRDPRTRDSGNTVLSKIFPSGVLIMTGANSAVGLRSMPVRYLFLDEVDAFPPDADGEGDPIALAIHRTATFARRKVFMVSTPTVAGASRIEAAYEESDQRKFWVPCPDCGEMQILEWQGVRWPSGKPHLAEYACAHCGVLIPNHRKPAMLAGGTWRPSAAGDGRTVGFHLSSLYSPWQSWAQCAVEFVQAKGNDDRLKTWTNLVLAETWSERGDAPEWRRLWDRRESYPLGTVPAGGFFLTAGVDVQRDRIEVELVAWGPNRESWSVDHRVIEGDPFSDAPWRALSQLVAETFPHERGGRLAIGRLAVDTGFATAAVYAWARQHSPRQVMAIKGTARLRVALGAPTAIEVTIAGRKRPLGLKLWPVGVDVFKAQLYGWLRQDRGEEGPVPPGWCHLPDHSEEWFKQLVAEQLVARANRNGFKSYEWKKTRERNEALDCRVYAMAAAEAAGVHRWHEDQWAQLSGALSASETSAPARPAAPAAGVIRSKWMER